MAEPARPVVALQIKARFVLAMGRIGSGGDLSAVSVCICLGLDITDIRDASHYRRVDGT